MIGIFIYIEWMKGIQRIMGCKFQLAVNILVSKNWDEVCTAHYCIEVDNSKAVWFGIDDPHTHVLIWFISHMVIPTNESAWILYIVKCEWEEELSVSNLQPSHPLKCLITADQYSIIVRGPSLPWWHCMNMFMTHATNSAQITWSKKGWDCWYV